MRLKVVGVSSSRFLPLLVADFDQLGGIPLAEIDLEVLQFEPALQQVNLGGFPRAIQAFHGDQPAGETEFSERFHQQRTQAKPALMDYNSFLRRSREKEASWHSHQGCRGGEGRAPHSVRAARQTRMPAIRPVPGVPAAFSILPFTFASYTRLDMERFHLTMPEGRPRRTKEPLPLRTVSAPYAHRILTVDNIWTLRWFWVNILSLRHLRRKPPMEAPRSQVHRKCLNRSKLGQKWQRPAPPPSSVISGLYSGCPG